MNILYRRRKIFFILSEFADGQILRKNCNIIVVILSKCGSYGVTTKCTTNKDYFLILIFTTVYAWVEVILWMFTPINTMKHIILNVFSHNKHLPKLIDNGSFFGYSKITNSTFFSFKSSTCLERVANIWKQLRYIGEPPSSR